MVERLTVNLGGGSYPIHFGADLSSAVAHAVGDLTSQGRRVVLVIDEQVAVHHAATLAAMAEGAPTFLVSPGETSKSVAVLGRIWDFLAEARVDRGGVVVAVGGGVVGDLAGFAAASYLRGIDCIQVPTTLLSMVDSSVGGKTGINISAGKNLVGAFHQPVAVYISTDLLTTLPAREFAAGMAEVIKYGLLGDVGLFDELEAAPLVPGDARLAAVVRRCCAAKARVVEADEFETAKDGGRALLNLGHTFGHAVEKVTGYGTYLHGEAVAVGLAAAARLSVELGLIDEAVVARVEAVLTAHGLPARLREPVGIEELMTAMARDKKVRAGKLRFVVLRAPGEAATMDGIEDHVVRRVWAAVGAS